MDPMSADWIIDMIYKLDPEVRAESVFVCDHETARGLRKLQDGDGRFVWRDGLSKTEEPRLFGYRVQADKRYAGFAFGPFPPLPIERPIEFYAP